MLRIAGSNKVLCDGLSRRDLLHVGGLGALGLTVADTPISPKDILATTLHLLGIDPHTMVKDRQGRPLPVVGDGRVRQELLG